VATDGISLASNIEMLKEMICQCGRVATNKFLATFVLGLAIAASAFAQTPDKSAPPASRPAPAGKAAQPTAEQILDRYVAAIGGREAWKKLNSRVATGTIEVPNSDASVTVDFRDKAPNRLLHTIVFNGATFRHGYDGTIAWTDDPKDGLREETGAALADTQFDADFYHPLDLRKLYSKFTVTGQETIGERDAYLVEAARTGADPDKLYFDTQSALVIRMISYRHTSEGLIVYQEDFEDYRQVDGVKLPFTVHQTSKVAPSVTASADQSEQEQSFTVRFAEVHHNVELDDQQFSKPAAQ